MPDKDWTRHSMATDEMNYLDSLTVSRTQDEFGQAKYFITDYNGDWVGEPFDTPELAFDKIDEMRNA